MGKDRKDMTYRWNDDLQRVEFWNTMEWCASAAGRNRNSAVLTTEPVVSYDDTWCEPTEQTTRGNDR